MNEPTQTAQETTGKTNARSLLACVKLGSDSLGMHGTATEGRASYSDSFVFTVRARKGNARKGVETTSEVTVPGWVSNGHDSTREERVYDYRKVVSYSGVHRPHKGFWYLSYGPRERLIDILELLPSDAEVAFHVYLDAGTNEYLIRANAEMNHDKVEGLHSDHLYLVAWHTRHGKRIERRYLIDSTAGAHNTARFGYRK